MIWFLAMVGSLTVAVLFVLLRPMIRPPGSTGDDAEPVTDLFRRQLSSLDEELAEGRLTAQEAAVQHAEITRRLLAAADRAASGQDGPAPTPTHPPVRGRGGWGSDMSWRFGAAIVIAGLLPATAMVVYFAVGNPAAIDRTAGAIATDPHDAAELSAAADEITAHLQKAPEDARGWTLLGRTLAALGRVPAARDAYIRAIALSPNDVGLHAELGEVLVLAAHGTVTPEAEAEFAKAPDDPRSRYYSAEAALQRGDPAAARQKLQALLASAPADAPWRQSVADRLAELSQPAGPAASASAAGVTAPASGPTAQDVAAAQSMTPAAREAMIRGMVERLGQQLQQRPNDKAGWERLAHAYDVLGEPGKAQAARARAAAAGNGATPKAPP
jgi:cytochrome c-type biogenesis protein CcmH